MRGAGLRSASAADMELDHLALAVRDEAASRRFYQTYFGFEVARRAEDGTLMMRNADAFSLALGRWDEEVKLPSFLHFGFDAESPERVHEYTMRFRDDGLEIVEEWDEPGYVSVKVRDPSGYVVEVSWEPN
jgi:catechol 2,3-dioxygenase-like lactoylglutathione lyase family enzyme